MARSKKFMIFYLKGGRIGSVPLTKRNETEAQACMQLGDENDPVVSAVWSDEGGGY